MMSTQQRIDLAIESHSAVHSAIFPPPSILYSDLKKTESAQDSCSTCISVEYLETTPRRMARNITGWRGKVLLYSRSWFYMGESLERVDKCSRDDSRYIIAGNPVSLQLYMNPRTLPSRHVCEMIDKRDDKETKTIWKFSFLFPPLLRDEIGAQSVALAKQDAHKSFFFKENLTDFWNLSVIKSQHLISLRCAQQTPRGLIRVCLYGSSVTRRCLV